MCSLNSQVYLDNEESNNYEADLVACPNSIYKVGLLLTKKTYLKKKTYTF